MKTPSRFTVCLTMIVVMIIGAALIPHLDVGFQPPQRQGTTLTVNYKWSGASAKVVEHGVTSVIEGIVSKVKGIEEVTSESYAGRGRVRARLKKGQDVSAVRFEISSLLRQVYSGLPVGVSYPTLTGGEVVNDDVRTNLSQVVVTYNINGDMDENDIMDYAERTLVTPLQKVEGVKKVELSGPLGDYLEITYNPERLSAYGISPDKIVEAVRHFTGKSDIVGDVLKKGERNMKRQTMYLSASDMNLADVPVLTKEGHTIYLNSLVTAQRKPKAPGKYYRINGMNTVYMNVYVAGDANLMVMSSTVQRETERLAEGLEQGVAVTMAYDAAKEERVEVFHLVSRSLISLLILLICVWLTRRNWRYLTIIASTLIANILAAVVAYWLFDVRLHVFSMAGVTVSMALIIDSSIVMADHYSYYHDRKAFLSLLAAVLTTIGSLATVSFLPEAWREDLYDFSWIITINLVVSLIVALLFVPALTDTLHYDSRCKTSGRAIKRIIFWNRFYAKYITLLQRRRWMGYLLLLLAFGIPLFALPHSLGDETENMTWYQHLYNNTIGSSFVQKYCMNPLQKATGGTLRLFVESIGNTPDPESDDKQNLIIRGQLPQGGTATELNLKVLEVDNLLKGMDGVKRFTTTVDGREARINVEFVDSCRGTSIPYQIENKVIDKLLTIGGADWGTYGVRPLGFSNSLNLQHRGSRILIVGYNFDKLYAYAEEVMRYLEKNPRMRDLTIQIPGYDNSGEEFHMEYNRDRMALYDTKASDLHSSLANMLKSYEVMECDDGKDRMDVVLKSSQRDVYDRWMMMNSYMKVNGTDRRVAGVVGIKGREITSCIPKKDQKYILSVAFNVLGSVPYTHHCIEEAIDYFNHRLPMGFKCMNAQYRTRTDTVAPYWIIAVVVVVIFFICAILFESLRVPLVIISMIPVSFVGLFLTYWVTEMNFGKGGFAAMVMLASLVVNAAIYIVNEYRLMHKRRRNVTSSETKIYIRAFNHKIVPVLLTTLSTVFGLLPFLLDVEVNDFWSSFAVGVCGGLLFSLLAVVFVIPLFLKLTPSR